MVEAISTPETSVNYRTALHNALEDNHPRNRHCENLKFDSYFNDVCYEDSLEWCPVLEFTFSCVTGYHLSLFKSLDKPMKTLPMQC